MRNPTILFVVHYLFLVRTGTVTDSPKNKDNAIFDAIKKVHEQMDDNHDGQINEVETADYIKTELNSTSNRKKQSHFHNNDADISVEDLWKKWLESSMYSWNVDDVVRWLIETVKLPQYEETFRKNNVIGKNLPRLATGKAEYVRHELKITNPIDRRKIYLRASDLILFGGVDGNGIEEKPELDKNFLALKELHSRLDDDRDGEINKVESVDFADDLPGPITPRINSFHRTDDLISFDDLCKSWKYSAVYNWTTDDVVYWLKDIVGLPEYEQNFREKNVDGKDIPRLASDKLSFLQKELGVTNSTHRKKIYLRASDIILFGAPTLRHNYFSDAIVLMTVIIASTVALYAVHQKSVSKKQIRQLKNNMEYLQQAEQMLKELQESEVNNSSKERELQLRGEIEAAKKEAERLHREQSKYEEEKTKLQLVEQELNELRVALAKAENEIKYNEIRSPSALQHLLILTYRKEVQHFIQKKQQALAQMQEAKEACEKVNKTKKAVFGSLRLAHGQSIDVVDQKILSAKSALAEVTKNLQERLQRWQQIEYICNFNIINEESNLNAQGKNSLSKPLLTDNVMFGSKGHLDLLDSQVAAENEMLDNEVEAITQKAKFIRTSTDTSSSQESINSKSEKLVIPHTSPLLRERTVKSKLISDDINGNMCGSTSASPALDLGTLHTSMTCPDLEKLALETKLNRTPGPTDKVYSRSNTEPNSITTRSSDENLSSKKFNNDSKKNKFITRPLSMGDSKSFKKHRKLLNLSNLTNSS